MTSGDYNSPASLNEFQARRLSVTCQYIDRVIGEIEEILNSAASKAAFPKYQEDVSPAQRRTLEDYLSRIRAQLVRVLDGQGIPRPEPSVPVSRAVYTSLTVIDIAVEELRPRYMRGYGEVPPEVATELEGISGELRGLVARVNQYLLQGTGQDLKNRLQRLEATASELELLAKLEQVITERGLVEFRSTVAGILDRLEDQSLEVAVFGRVSAGKSSLLNAILGEEILPVGVTPITAVPTRIRYGAAPLLTVAFAERATQTFPLDRLMEVASEKGNPHNEKRVARIVLDLPSPRLQEGVTLVDTPGLGSLATTGASETLAYLPKCDLGVVLIDAGSTLTPEDLRTIDTLHEAGIPVQVLLSKADLLTDGETAHMVSYVKEHVSRECRIDVPVYPVSALAGHRAQLSTWFEAEIHPLFEKSRELKALSIKRKVGVVRDSVAAALTLRLRRSRGIAGTDPDNLREVESRLRRATGQMTETRNHIEQDVAIFERAAGWFLEKAGASLAEAWEHDPSPTGDHDFVVFESILRNVHQETKVYRQQLEALAHELQAELSRASKALGLPHGPADDEFSSIVRAMPVFDFGARDLRISKPRFSRVFGKAAARAALRKALRKRLEPPLGQSLSVYSHVFRDWSGAVLQQLERKFSSFADGYRAQAERAQAAGGIGTEEENALLADLRSLGAEGLEKDSRMPVATTD
jgi:GTP-binding protein EngB required for normal cell division